jgi:hypothetical protein
MSEPEQAKFADPRTCPEAYYAITWNGETRTLKGWADHLGVKYNRLYVRLFRYNWPPEEVLRTAREARPRPPRHEVLHTPEAKQKATEKRAEAMRTPEVRQKMRLARLADDHPEKIQSKKPKPFQVNADMNQDVINDKRAKIRRGTKNKPESIAQRAEKRRGLQQTAEAIARATAAHPHRKFTVAQRRKLDIAQQIAARARAAGVDPKHWRQRDNDE